MRRPIRLTIAAAAAAALLGACGKPPQDNAPLAFVPADTPYVYANLQPVPAATTEQWSKPLQEYWPSLFSMYQSMLQDPKLGLSDRTRRIAGAIMDEFKTHADWQRLRQIGLKPDARVAIYGVGLVPVLRLELGDAAALRAEIARVEQAAGEKLPVAKVGDFSYWQVGGAGLAAAIAIEDTHLVVTMLPANASDGLKRTLLGLDRPAHGMAGSGALEALARQYDFSPYGAGYLDLVRLVERLSKPLEGSDAEFARTLGLPALPANDETCRREYLEIAHAFPRLVVGATELSAQRMRIVSQLEMEAGLAGRVAAAAGAAPGSGGPVDGAADFSVALPVLRLKDFWIAQADAAAAKPYACASLKAINDGFAQAKAKLDVTVPPPFSDLTGLRVSLSKVDIAGPGTLPDVAGKLLLATTNPAATLAMAQLTLPALQKVKVAADGKPVALPGDLLPMKLPALSVAMSDKAIALASGAEAASLPAFLAAPAANDATFLRVHVSGAVYGWMARAFQAMKANLPPATQKSFDAQITMFGVYEKWLRSNDFALAATPTGIRLQQTIEVNP